MRKTSRLLVSNPTSTRRNSANVRTSNPAPTSNITAAAISATTSPARSRPEAPADTAAPSLSAPAIGVRLARKVGTALPTAVTRSASTRRERRDSRVQGHFVQARNVGGRDGQGRVHPPRREHDGDDRRDDRAQHAFRDQLSRDAASAGSERQANRHLPRAGDTARDGQAGDVGADQQQQAEHRREDEEELQTARAGDFIGERKEPDTPTGVGVRMLGLQSAAPASASAPSAPSRDIPAFIRPTTRRNRASRGSPCGKRGPRYDDTHIPRRPEGAAASGTRSLPA